MLTIESLTVGYGSQSVMQEVSLTVQPGEIVALIGPNGAGKTTLFRAIRGVLRPSSGHVYAFSQEISHLPSDRRARLLAVVPQARRLPTGYTVRQTVLIGPTELPVDGNEGRTNRWPGADSPSSPRIPANRSGMN